MKDMLLMGAIKTKNFADNMTERASRAAKGENGDVVQTVIIIGIFVVICVIVGGMILNAMKTQGETLSKCIEGVNTTTGCSNYSK